MRATLSRSWQAEKTAGGPLPELDRFGGLYAGRMEGTGVAETRDLTSSLSQPDVISLAGGFPDTTTLGEETFLEVCAAVASGSARALQYGPATGLDQIRDVVVDVMAAEETPAQRENILITAGAQQALDLIGKVFLDEGDAVLCEGPTYAGALSAFSFYGPRIIHVPMDGEGMVPSAVRKALRRARRQGIRVKFIYTVPTFQNPSGSTLSIERRRELLEIAREFDLIIVEDNPYGMLRFEGEPHPTLAALEQESGDVHRVVYLGTFSKIFAPGVRLGWVHAHPDILRRINAAKRGADLCSSNLSQMMVSSYFQNADWRAYVSRLIDIYRERRDMMLDSLAEYMPGGVIWTRPEGGLFIWVTLPSCIDTTDMLSEAVVRNVAYVPGEGFYANGDGQNRIRLNFSFAEPEKIRRGIQILAGLIRERIELESSPANAVESAA